MYRIALVVTIAVATNPLYAGSPAKNDKAAKETGPVLKTPHGDVAIFPADNPWNQPVDKLPVHAHSADYIASIGADKTLHPDFGTEYNGAPNGIPFCVVPPNQPKVKVSFEYADESDPGPYPIPPDAPIEGGEKSDGDRHILVLDPKNNKLYELFAAHKTADGWKAGSGAIFDLSSNKLRPAGWTSADAAGLPVFPGLARYDEAVEAGEIRHALRFTVRKTQRGYIAPATHFASRSSDPKLPPMGLRVRLKAGFDDSKAPKSAQAILRCLKTYGMILADNGGDWFISGAPNPKWNDDELRWLKKVKGSDLEAVETGKIVTK
ncbi:MAG: hypothetical protein L6R28_16460 [Planctomycetes bacterium]|nr:hypothetical protein [Planctomycetota bacterium]